MRNNANNNARKISPIHPTLTTPINKNEAFPQTTIQSTVLLNIGPEPVNTPLYQSWIHKRRALIQITLDGAAQK